MGEKGSGQSEGKRRERSGRRKSENLDRSVAQKTRDDAAIIQKIVINVIRGRRANLLRREIGIREEAREHCQGEKVLVCKSR